MVRELRFVPVLAGSRSCRGRPAAAGEPWGGQGLDPVCPQHLQSPQGGPAQAWEGSIRGCGRDKEMVG